MRLRPPAVVLILLVMLLALPGQAAANPNLIPQTALPDSPTVVPPGYSISPREAARVVERTRAMRELRAKVPGLERTVVAPLYLNDKRWQVSYAPPGETDWILEYHVDGRSGRVIERWTGPQVDWLIARGYDPPMGGKILNKPYVWLPLCLLFLAPFFDPRRPFRLLHLDLVMMLGFGISQYFVNQGNLDVSVPLAYPFLVYLLVRLLLAGFRPRERSGRVVPVLPMAALAIGLVLLVGFRLAINIADGTAIDVGIASTVGADRIAHGDELYTDNDVHGDTYGPINYIAYLPFEALLPYSDSREEVPAAQAAALTFDLLTIIGLILLGARMRPGREGRRLGLALGFAWAAYPYSTYVIQAGTNDGLVSMLLVFALLGLQSAPARGALVGLGAAAKFVPLALAPLFAAGTGERDLRSLARFAVVLTIVVAGSLILYLPNGGLREFWDATLGYQLGRESPFSIWGLHPSLEPLKLSLTLAAGALAASLFFVPRRRDLRQVAALAGAVIVALQLSVEHWYYFYLVWIAPVALVAMLGAYRSPDVPAGEDKAPERARELAHA